MTVPLALVDMLALTPSEALHAAAVALASLAFTPADGDEAVELIRSLRDDLASPATRSDAMLRALSLIARAIDLGMVLPLPDRVLH